MVGAFGRESYEVLKLELGLFDCEPDVGEEVEEMLIKKGESGDIVLQGRRGADEGTVVDEEKGVDPSLIVPWKEALDYEGEVQRGQDGTEQVTLRDAV